MELRQRALELLALADPAAKAAAVRGFAAADALPLDAGAVLESPLPLPGRPARPRLVNPAALPRRSAHTLEGRSALLHAVAHIEFNAINLALDAIWRFPGLPAAYYADWQRVAGEEARHFELLAAHLASLGRSYGDFDAHDGLWAMVERTSGDFVARMALVPRTLEARGLDATPPMRAALARAGDHAAAAILDVILHDEIGHVAVGNRWYHHGCRAAGLDPVAHESVLRERYRAPPPRPPFNLEARAAAGFAAEELAALQRAALAP